MGKGIELEEPELTRNHNTYTEALVPVQRTGALQQQQTPVTKSTAAMVRHVILLILFT